MAKNLVSWVQGCFTAPAGRGSGAASGPSARAVSRCSPARTGPGAGHEPLAPASRVTFPFSRPHRAISGKSCLLPCISASVRRNVTPCPVTAGEDAPPHRAHGASLQPPGRERAPLGPSAVRFFRPRLCLLSRKHDTGNRAGPLRGRVDAYFGRQTRVCTDAYRCAFFVGPIE